MPRSDFESKLQQYAELAVRVGLNLQPGQHLGITAHGSGTASTAFARLVVESAYRAGAAHVDALIIDDQYDLIRIQNADQDSLSFSPSWPNDRDMAIINKGGALLGISARDPNLLAGQEPERVAMVSQSAALANKPTSEALGRGAMNWLALSIPSAAWAALVFPDMPDEEQQPQLWNSLFELLRLNEPDPVVAWRNHIDQLVARRLYLTDKQYAKLKFTGPGTDLTVGLASHHIWQGGSATTQNGIDFTPNLPTEEIFTLPHLERVEGVVRATKPLSLRGVLVEDFRLTFREGQVVNLDASTGKETLQKLIDTDDGAGRLGEVALVPHSSPVSSSGLLFFNTLYDENAACHIALGRAYKISHEDGASMSDEEFLAAGGNDSIVHVDFMIGSHDLDVDGFGSSGEREPILRSGEWAFDV